MINPRLLKLLIVALTLVCTWWWFNRPVPAPHLELTSINGERFSLAALTGRPLLVYFWSPDCTVCIQEMPELEKFYQQLSTEVGMAMVGIATRSSRPNRVLNAAKNLGLSYPVVLDPMGEASAALGPVRATPYIVLIDPAGRIVSRQIGKRDIGRLERRIRRLASAA